MDKTSDAPLTEHLGELRYRILLSLGSFLLTFAILTLFSDALVAFSLHPLRSVRPDLKPVTLSVVEGFFSILKLSAYGAIALNVPLFIFQAWSFVKPGLLEPERRWCRLLLAPVIICFYGGCLFCYLLVLPLALRFLLDFSGNFFAPTLSFGGYVDFVVFFMLIMGAVFELPLGMTFLDALGVLPAETVASHRRHAIVIAFIVGAIFSPPDVFSQILVSIPIVFLVEAGIRLSFFFRKLRKAPEKQGVSEENDPKTGG